MNTVRAILVLLCCCFTLTAFAQIKLQNDANIDMTGSPGSQIVFPDGSTLGAFPEDHGGTNNMVTGGDAFVGGGESNMASGGHAVVSGGFSNEAAGQFSTISGGNANSASGYYGATVGGGTSNAAIGAFSTSSGGLNNDVHADYGTASGGESNLVTDNWGTIGGGEDNQAGNGTEMTDDATHATVGGGYSNQATSDHATIAGGSSNLASGDGTAVAGGKNNVASGIYSAIPGGQFNATVGAYSFSAGRNAKANHAGSFVWSDNTGTNLTTSAEKTFLARASNGFKFYTKGDLGLGAELGADQTAWAPLCDRNAKENIVHVDAESVLELLAAMPVAFFNYKGADPADTHIGVMAQDFHAAFDLGGNPLRISTQDADGVAFAAIQGLHARLERANDEIARKQSRIEALEARLAAIEYRLATVGLNAH